MLFPSCLLVVTLEAMEILKWKIVFSIDSFPYSYLNNLRTICLECVNYLFPVLLLVSWWWYTTLTTPMETGWLTDLRRHHHLTPVFCVQGEATYQESVEGNVFSQRKQHRKTQSLRMWPCVLFPFARSNPKVSRTFQNSDIAGTSTQHIPKGNI